MILSLAKKSRQQKQGFTLVELLIVCALVTLLSAMLLSVFSRVRNGARRTSCQNNLRQIGLACEMYASDNRGHYPNTASLYGWADRVLPYIRATSVFECPSALNSPYIPGRLPENGSDNKDEFGGQVNYHGAYNICIFNKAIPSVINLRHPASTISVLDGSGDWIIPGGKDLADSETFQKSGIKPPRHQGGSDILFFDGHVKWMRYEALQDRTLWNLGTPPPLK